MLTFSQRRFSYSSLELASKCSSSRRRHLAGTATMHWTTGHVFNRKLGGRGTGLRVHRAGGLTKNHCSPKYKILLRWRVQLLAY